MSRILKVWQGTGFDKNVRLTQYKYSDGSIHYTFYDRIGCAGNPTQAEAEQIIKSWRLEEVQA